MITDNAFNRCQMEKFEVTAELTSPLVIGGGYFTLDALLGGVLFENLSVKRPISFVANLRADHSLHPDLILKNKDGGIHRRLGKLRRSDFGQVLNSYSAFDTPDVVWYAEGDPEKTERLLSDVHFIGKRRGSGFGEVKGWQIEPSEFNGVTGPFDEPMRPVPVEQFKGDPASLKVDAAWRPAYWHPENRAVCYAPRGLT